jgi:cysteine desulfurase family protein
MIYLDNAATTFPKPESVYSAVSEAFRECSGNPGRSGHKLSLAAGRIVEECRLLVAQLLHAAKPERVVFAMNTTEALNLALKGVLSCGDHVITGSMEHNSVARTLEFLKTNGVEYTKVPASPIQGVALRDIESAIKENTKLIVLNHISNVTGTENPIAEIGRLSRKHGILFLVDAAQSAGIHPIDVQAMNIDFLAFPGHKGLLGPQGTGGLYIREGIDINPLKHGGTGSFSELLAQPEQLPDRYESGTQNTPGLAGLAAGVRYILDHGVEYFQEKEARLANRLINGLSELKEVTIYGPPPGASRSGVVSVRIDGIDVIELSMILDNVFNIAVRAGLHCASDAHATLGTLHTGGTLRISAGSFNTEEEIDFCISALAELSSEGSMKEVT